MVLYEAFNTIVVVASVIASAATLGYWLASKFERLEARLSKVEENYGKLEQRTSEIESRFDRIETRLYSIEKGLYSVESRLDGVELKFERLEDRISRLENALLSYNELLLKVLESKGLLTSVESYALLQALRASLPRASSRYYTKEVEERLRALLEKDPKDYTLEDVKELQRIADLMFEEYTVTKREDLLEYQARLRVAAQVIKIVYVEPKILKGEQVLKPGLQEKPTQ